MPRYSMIAKFKCGVRIRELSGPWMGCTRDAIYEFKSIKGHRSYFTCAYHAKDLKDDPRIAKREIVRKRKEKL